MNRDMGFHFIKAWDPVLMGLGNTRGVKGRRVLLFESQSQSVHDTLPGGEYKDADSV